MTISFGFFISFVDVAVAIARMAIAGRFGMVDGDYVILALRVMMEIVAIALIARVPAVGATILSMRVHTIAEGAVPVRAVTETLGLIGVCNVLFGRVRTTMGRGVINNRVITGPAAIRTGMIGSRKSQYPINTLPI